MSVSSQILDYTLLALGFGFVIFFHELGHFLAAKYVGISVEQFAVGFGQAIVSWRSGLGVRFGSTQEEYRKKVKEYVEKTLGQPVEDVTQLTPSQLRQAGQALHIGETEYRWNWIPLGGYVKMLGQDDLNPNSRDSDPHSYNMQPIRSRMLVVSAGVIMNIILAAIGFMIVFLIGFNAPPAVVGAVLPGSPAQNGITEDGKKASLRVGDRILTFEGKPQYDFTKIALNVALVYEGTPVPIEVKHPDGTVQTLKVTPARTDSDNKGFLALGIMPPEELEGVDAIDGFADLEKDIKDGLMPAEDAALRPGDTIISVAGTPIADPKKDFYKFDEALQNSDGKPIPVTVRDASGNQRTFSVQPHFMEPFSREDMSFAGMIPRAAIYNILDRSPARGKLLPNDAIASISFADNSHDTFPDPTSAELTDKLNAAGREDTTVNMTVLRDGKLVDVPGLTPTLPIAEDRKGLGIGLRYEEGTAVVADVTPDSPAAVARIHKGDRIIELAGQPVTSWYDVKRILSQAKPGEPISVVAVATNPAAGADGESVGAVDAKVAAPTNGAMAAANGAMSSANSAMSSANGAMAASTGTISAANGAMSSANGAMAASTGTMSAANGAMAAGAGSAGASTVGIAAGVTNASPANGSVASTVAGVATPPGRNTEHYTITLPQDDIASIAGLSYTSSLSMHELVEPRITHNPLIAAEWGIIETRDFVLQFYLTLRRMVEGSVGYKNMMGPVGIFTAGARFAYKGTDWLIWFLSMISANLAVVNFLPIPIVDGGLFTFLILEKIPGRPLSPKAQQVAQIIGLALILGVFLLVTYQDIARMWHA